MIERLTDAPGFLAAAFASGVCTSFGPCVAPRYVAVATLVRGNPRPLIPIVAFTVGVIAAFTALGSIAGGAAAMAAGTAWVDRTLAVMLLAAGVWTLIDTGHRSDTHERGGASASPGGAALLGAASAFVVSPCCAPFLFAVIGMAGSFAQPCAGPALLAAFACGHAMPLIGLAVLSIGMRERFARVMRHQTQAIVGGSLLLAFSAYYAVLA